MSDLALYTATLEARARGWVGLEEGERKRRAAQACQGYDLEELWSLTEAHLYAFGRKKSRTSDRTLTEYRRGVKVLLDDARHDGLNLVRPRRDWGALWVSSLEARSYETKGGKAKKLSPSTVTVYVAAARALYKALRWAGATEADPLRDVSVTPDPTPPWERRRAYPQRDVDRLLPYCDLRRRVLVLLGAHAGLRASEVSRLERSHLHSHDGTLFVAESKGRKSRSVAVSKSLQQALEQYLEALPPRAVLVNNLGVGKSKTSSER